MNEKGLGNRLKMYRISLHMTQSELSVPLNMSRQTVSTYETGVRVPDIFTLCTMADIFKVSVDELIGRDTRLRKISTR